MNNHFTVGVLRLIIVQLQVTTAQIPDECWSCGCCAYGYYNKCDINGYCNNGCQDGYWGDNCNKKCMYTKCYRCDRTNGYICECRPGYYGIDCESWCGTNCDTCDKTKGCLSCKDDYWGSTCNKKCIINCNVCSKSNGQCNSCVNGYWGRFCDDKCGSQCKTCNKWNGCTVCNKGYYGSKCGNYCGDNCASCDKQLGCTACDTGYNGPSCMCDANCIQCDNLKGCTSCKPGYYSNKGVCHECVYKLLGCTCTYTQNCIGCINGYFLKSNICSPCPHNCITCTTSTQCTSCTEGRFGNICQYQCSEGCFRTCHTIDGSCKCKEGWAGDRCDKCDDRYFGNMCSEQCRNSCSSCTGDYNCQRCTPGYYGAYCQYKCGKGCINDSCDIKSGHCQCKNNKFIKSKASGYCYECVSGQYGPMCEQNCPKMCKTCKNETNCVSCNVGYFGKTCKKTCPVRCKENTCKKKDGSCFTCKPGYFGMFCENICPESCQLCDQYDSCSECKAGYSNTQKQCTCRTDICLNSVGCDSCTNISYYANDNECCLCSINHCVSCTKTIDNIHCKTCRKGYFPHNNGQCKTCNSQCVDNECDPSSGRCLQGCTHGYWNQTCDIRCDPECVSCDQADGSCSKCKYNTKYGPSCKLECSNTCENSMCDIYGNCTNGCITNKFGKQCENTCDEHCTPNENKTICSEKTGMCFYGCQTEFRGTFCPQVVFDTEAGKQNWSIAALGVGIAGGVVVLAAIVVVGLFLLRRSRVNLRIISKAHGKEPENLLEMYAKVNNGTENSKGDTDNSLSVTVIGMPTYQSPTTNRSGNERTPILTEDNLEIVMLSECDDISDEDDASARESAIIFEENGGFYFNNAEEISKIKLNVTDLPEYVHNICITDLEEEFQKIPYDDDTRVLVRGGETDYINASFIDGFRRRNAYIATLGPMAKQLGDFGQFWRMVWQQKVEKIVMVTNLVEGKKTKCEQYWPDHYQRNVFGDIKVVCKDEKLYTNFIWRNFTLFKNSEKRSLHHLQFTSWPDKDIPDDVTSFIEFRQRVNALASTFDGPVVVHCRFDVKLWFRYTDNYSPFLGL
ncbi:PTPRS-like protein [Mya arenaria]|uniref:protein-tyrosine-phosphatase n=1 Tax=Mya arenaria TaxID=6604 RepID=A0ABY7F5M1_MYAAR|nr:PTPRS-like protein [Mya arenaria]